MFNMKVNNDGSYRNFLGYTTLAMAKTDLSFIEDYIKKSKCLSKYYSPLPSSSYHMTTFNVWCQQSNLLTPYQKELQKFNCKEIKDVYRNKNLNYWYDPINFMNMLMMQLDIFAKKYDWTNLKTSKVQLYANEGTISLLLHLNTENMEKINSFRNDCSNVCEKDDAGLVMHLTLAYSYKNILQEDIDILKEECNKLSRFVNNLEIDFFAPKAYRFNTMESYIENKSFNT